MPSVDAVHLRPGDAVADLGIGIGLFTQLFAERVGWKGKVYAVDVGLVSLKHIDDQAKRMGQEQVIKTGLGTQDATNLLPGSIDVVLSVTRTTNSNTQGRCSTRSTAAFVLAGA